MKVKVRIVRIMDEGKAPATNVYVTGTVVAETTLCARCKGPDGSIREIRKNATPVYSLVGDTVQPKNFQFPTGTRLVNVAETKIVFEAHFNQQEVNYVLDLEGLFTSQVGRIREYKDGNKHRIIKDAWVYLPESRFVEVITIATQKIGDVVNLDNPENTEAEREPDKKTKKPKSSKKTAK